MRNRLLKLCVFTILATSLASLFSCSKTEPSSEELVTPEQKEILKEMGESYKK